MPATLSHDALRPRAPRVRVCAGAAPRWAMLGAAVGIVLAAQPASIRANQPPAAREERPLPPGAASSLLLREKGLTRAGRSAVWVSSLERRLRDRLDELPRLRGDIVRLEGELNERIRENETQWQQMKQVAETIANARKNPLHDQSRLREMEELHQHLAKQFVAPEELGGRPDVQSRLIDLSTHRYALITHLEWIRESAPRVAASYDALDTDAEVARALAAFGVNHRLGPARDYAPEIAKFDRYDAAIDVPYVPLYRESNRLRVAALANHKHPITFTWHPSAGPTLLSRTVAETLELPLNEGQAGVVEIDGRRIRARKVVVPYLRFGKYVLRDVEAWILSPEGEDLGSRIGVEAFKGYTVHVEPAQLRLRIEAASE